MQNKSATKLTLALLAATALSACNGGSSTASASNNAVQTNQLQQYIDSLSFTPAGSKQVTALGTRQQSFTTPGALTINSVDIKFYSGESCTGENVFTQTLNAGGTTPVTPAAGTYTSTNASNNALCTNYANEATGRANCGGLYDDMLSANMRSVQYTYNINNGSGGSYPIVAGCMYNASAQVGMSAGLEGLADWTSATNASFCSAGACGFSQSYNVNLASSIKSIFVTPELQYSGDLLYDANNAPINANPAVTDGFAGGDAICQYYAQESGYPGTYKALVAGTNRAPGGNDWVIQAGATYVRASDTSVTIATATESAILPSPLTNPIVATASSPAITGFAPNANPWRVITPADLSGTSNCSDWSVHGSSDNSVAGWSAAEVAYSYMDPMAMPPISGFLTTGQQRCDGTTNATSIYCVQQ